MFAAGRVGEGHVNLGDLPDEIEQPLAQLSGALLAKGVQSHRKRQVQTRLGPIRLKRWWHYCWKCGHGWSRPDHARSRAFGQLCHDVAASGGPVSSSTCGRIAAYTLPVR